MMKFYDSKTAWLHDCMMEPGQVAELLEAEIVFIWCALPTGLDAEAILTLTAVMNKLLQLRLLGCLSWAACWSTPSPSVEGSTELRAGSSRQSGFCYGPGRSWPQNCWSGEVAQEDLQHGTQNCLERKNDRNGGWLVVLAVPVIGLLYTSAWLGMERPTTTRKSGVNYVVRTPWTGTDGARLPGC